MRYRSPSVGCLGPWSALIPTRFRVSRGTRDPSPCGLAARYGTVTRSGAPFQALPASTHATRLQVTAWTAGLTTPPTQRLSALTRRWFRQRPVSLATTPGGLLLPQGTKMFQFPWFPPALAGACVMHRRVAPFGDGWITVWVPLPNPVAGVPRPSSADGAEASSYRASCLAWSPASRPPDRCSLDTKTTIDPIHSPIGDQLCMSYDCSLLCTCSGTSSQRDCPADE